MQAQVVEEIKEIEEYSGFIERGKDALWIFKLENDYEYQTSLNTEYFNSKWLKIDPAGKITIRAGYAWNGCSFKISILDLFIFGTPDGIVDVEDMKPKAYTASLVHDALYQYMYYHSITRKQADKIFFNILKKKKFKLSTIYYCAVRGVGWIFYIGKKYKMIKENKNYKFL